MVGAKVSPRMRPKGSRPTYEKGNDDERSEHPGQDQATQGQVQDQSSASGDTTPAKLYSTKEECEAAKPTNTPKSLKAMEVSKGGTVVGWVLCRGYDHGLAQVARTEGYTVSTGVKAAPITTAAATAKVLEMDDNEWKALLAARKAAAKK